MPAPPFIGRVIVHAHHSLPPKASAMLKSGRTAANFLRFETQIKPKRAAVPRTPV